MSHIIALHEADRRCGGKAAGLGALSRDGIATRRVDTLSGSEGIAIPPGAVILDASRDGWKDELLETLPDLGPGPYAVRSSWLEEDGHETSFAGQLRTALNVDQTELLDAVDRVAHSLDARSTAAYAARLNKPSADGVTVLVPVLVQQMVDPDVSGVVFTNHPVTAELQCVVESIWGLGDRLVNGSVTPERWVIPHDQAALDHATLEHGLPEPVLTAHDARAIAGLALQAEAASGSPCDMEWTLADGILWVLQSRPLTALNAAGRESPLRAPLEGSMPGVVPSAGPSVSPRGGEHEVGTLLVTGTPASPGRAAGAVTVVPGLDDFARFRTGDVLVCSTTSPAWTPLLARASAVITETGGILAHAAIVAREFGIPTVVAAEGAMNLLASGDHVTVDGSHGVVTSYPLKESHP